MYQDTDPDYLLIKRWVPEYEQDFLWNHTREIRERRGERPIMVIESSKKEHHRRHRSEPEFEFIRKSRKHEKKLSPSPLLTFLAGGKPRENMSDAVVDDFHHHRHESEPVEFIRKSKKREKKLSPSPLLTFLAGGKPTENMGDAVVDDGKVDDLLAEYTTVFKEADQSPKKVETEKQDRQKETDEGAKISNSEEDRLGEEFLRSTRLDDYFSDDEHSVSSSSSSIVVRTTRRSRFMRRLRKLWPSNMARNRFRRKRAWSGSVSSGSGSGSSVMSW